MIPASEELARLEDLKEGPWNKRGHAATKFLAPRTDLLELVDTPETISLPLLKETLSSGDHSREPALAHVFRLHWLPDGDITSRCELKLRDSLDFALTFLQLVELAVETGYLGARAVRGPARETMLRLLWSDAARRFVEGYEYIGVEYLAARVGFPGFRTRDPPPPDESAEIRFASFLDHHRAWLEDAVIEEWLGFLDDHVEYPNEQQDFYQYLNGKNRGRASLRFRRLAAGADKSLVMLADLFGMLRREEQARFGLFYGYWLAKLFGFELGPDGFRGTIHPLDGGSWAAAIKKSELFVAEAEVSREYPFDPYTGTQFSGDSSDRLEGRLEVIERAWTAVQQLIGERAGHLAY